MWLLAIQKDWLRPFFNWKYVVSTVKEKEAVINPGRARTIMVKPEPPWWSQYHPGDARSTLAKADP